MLRKKQKYFPSAEYRRFQEYDKQAIACQKMLIENTAEAYGAMYADPDLLRHYLVDERLDFYKIVADRIVRDYQGDIKQASCLDVGCGPGYLLNELRQKGFSGRLVGIDAAGEAVARVKEHNANIEFYEGFLADQEWGPIFDVVICTEVLEHCEYPGTVLEDMLKVTKPSGLLVITVPDGRKDTWDGHINFWSPESFRIFVREYASTDSIDFDYFENTNYCAIHC